MGEWSQLLPESSNQTGCSLNACFTAFYNKQKEHPPVSNKQFFFLYFGYLYTHTLVLLIFMLLFLSICTCSQVSSWGLSEVKDNANSLLTNTAGMVQKVNHHCHPLSYDVLSCACWQAMCAGCVKINKSYSFASLSATHCRCTTPAFVVVQNCMWTFFMLVLKWGCQIPIWSFLPQPHSKYYTRTLHKIL